MTSEPLRPEPGLETTVTSTPTAPVLPPAADGSGAPRSNRSRWLAALGIVGVVGAATLVAAVALTGASPSATIAGYVPEDSVMYGEVRLDLPGDQRAEIGEFLSKFPGFADQAALETKIDEVLDRLVAEASDGEQTFTADIKPWFDGEVGFAVGPLPPPDADPAVVVAGGRGLLFMSIKDEALARAWFDEVLTEGTTTSTETYSGTELLVYDGPDLDAAFGIVGGEVAIAGDLASVKAAVDTGGSSDFASSEEVAAATEALEGDSVGFLFMDARALLDSAMALTEDMSPMPGMSATMLALVPDWIGMRMRVEGDALRFDTAMPDVEGAPGAQTNRANAVAEWAPASTIVLAAGNDYGDALIDTVALYRQEPALAEVFAGIDQAAGMLGGLDAALGWMGDTGIVVSNGADAAEGGIVSVPADAAGARQFLTTIRSFATLAGGQMGIEVRDETYGDATITIVSLGSLQDLAGLAGGLSGAPIDPSAPVPDDQVEIAYTATDGVVVIGSGPDFVKAVLDAGAGTSLADDARYGELVGRVGAEHTGVTFVDIDGIRVHIEGLLDEATAEERAEYEESIKPFLEPLDAVVGTAVAGETVDTQHVIVTVKE